MVIHLAHFVVLGIVVSFLAWACSRIRFMPEVKRKKTRSPEGLRALRRRRRAGSR